MACAFFSSCAQNAYLDTVKSLLTSSTADNDTRLNPEYEHLRITLSGRSAFVTLGDIDKHPDGDLNVYYGGGGLVIRLRNGRLAGVNGLLTDWRNVVMHNAPAWALAAKAGQVEWRRTRDVMPGYQYGIDERLILTHITPPKKNPLWQAGAEGLMWFEERIADSNASNNIGNANNASKLPPARYAVTIANQQTTVVYGEQCIAPDTCLTWQQWTPRKK